MSNDLGILEWIFWAFMVSVLVLLLLTMILLTERVQRFIDRLFLSADDKEPET
jgi:hypothetical protein